MERIYNFSAGPAMLPQEVLSQVQEEMLNWQASGMSVMEMSHRGKEYMGIHEAARHDLRELLHVPDQYRILFLQGGASAQFAMIPQNLLGDRTVVDYINTGEWSKKAIKEAKALATVNVAGSSEAEKFTRTPEPDSLKLDPDAAYVHFTPNETIGGVEFHWTPDTGAVPLVADMSSNILSKPLDVARYGLVYAGAQKNIGPAGVTVVIVREDLLDRARPATPSVLNYKVQADNDSMVNTPPTFAIYVAGLVFKWLKRMGGLVEMERRNVAKAAVLYDYLDNTSFYASPVRREDRSLMNVPFTLHDAGLDEAFLKGARERGLVQLKGHRSVGGMRASIYNAMPLEGVRCLVDYMKEFEQSHG